MKFTIVKEPIPYLYIENIYNQSELELIYKELEFLHPKLLPPERTSSAINQDGSFVKNNKGIFLDKLYNDNSFSDILTITRKMFTKEIIEAIKQCSMCYGIYETLGRYSTLLSYYEDGGSYKKHHDTSAITSVTWFFKRPKNFTGGTFTFSDYNLDINPVNNAGVIFFSSFKHEVSKVKIIDTTVPCSGRFTISHFVTHI
jgi:Rps23 Pro-64 3,4-dihydroxylase Tpa1-like proline 4-hydroxylase